MLMRRKKKKAFQIPEYFLRQLNEYTSSGFFLFTYNIDGSPDIYCNFDNNIAAMGMQQFVENWALSMKDLTQQGIKYNLVASNKK